MKILHVTPTYYPAIRYGGPIYSVHGLCKALVKMGHDCHVYTTNVNGKEDSSVALNRAIDLDGVKVTYFKSYCFRKIFYAAAMKKFCEKNIKNYDIVHLHSPYVWPTWMSARIAMKFKKPYVMTTRGMLVTELIRKKSRWAKKIWIRFVEKINLEHASLVQFTTDAEKKQVERFGFRFKKTIVLGHGFDENAFEASAAETASEKVKPFIQGKPYLLYVGRLSWEKGLERLIAAMPLVAGNISLILVGNGKAEYFKTLTKLAEKHNVQDRVTFAGPFYGKVKMDLYRCAIAFVLPSYSENFGNVLLEAMIQGCPVIVAPNVGLADFVESTGAGLVSKDSVEGLAESVNKLVDQPDLRMQMKSKGQLAVKEHFTWDKIAESMTREYQKTIYSFIKDQKP